MSSPTVAATLVKRGSGYDDANAAGPIRSGGGTASGYVPSVMCRDVQQPARPQVLWIDAQDALERLRGLGRAVALGVHAAAGDRQQA